MKKIFLTMMMLAFVAMPAFAQKKDLKGSKQTLQKAVETQDKKKMATSLQEGNEIKDNENKAATMESQLKFKRIMFQSELELSPTEFKAFWEVYESYTKELYAISERENELLESISRRQMLKTVDEINLLKIEDDQARALLICSQEKAMEQIKLDQVYVERFCSVMPVQKYLKMKDLDQTFDLKKKLAKKKNQDRKNQVQETNNDNKPSKEETKDSKKDKKKDSKKFDKKKESKK